MDLRRLKKKKVLDGIRYSDQIRFLDSLMLQYIDDFLCGGSPVSGCKTLTFFLTYQFVSPPPSFEYLLISLLKSVE